MNKEEILKIIREEKGATFKTIKNSLELYKKEDLRSLDRFLRSLAKENLIYFNAKREQYFLKDEEVYIGEFHETRHSYSFIEIENDEEELSFFCPQKFSMNALNGDTVKFKVFDSVNRDGEVKKVAKVLRIMKRNGSNIMGEIKLNDKGELSFIPIDFINQKHNYQIINKENLKIGNFVNAKFVDYKNYIIEIKITEVIFPEFKALYDHIFTLRKYNKEINFPQEIENLTKEDFLSTLKIEEQLDEKRIDLTDELIYTIDGESSKDLDDAISVSEDNEFYTLKVHIADVSYYVQRGSILDKEAKNRANSIYLIDFVRPMLPKFLSNDLCSLNPNEIKNTMTAEIKINKLSGDQVSAKFYKSKILSKHRLTYENVDKFYGGTFSFGDVELEKSLLLAKDLAEVLRQRKIDLGMIDFVLPEIKVDIDEEKEPIKIYDKYQTESEKVIEDLMVAANEEVAKYLTNKHILSIYRIHPKPNLEKLEELRMFAKTVFKPELFKNPTDWQNILAFTNTPADLITSKQLSKYISSIEELDNNVFLKVNLIQTMEKARYEIQNSGHYALGLTHYLHFTSPIRRYADLEVHRLLTESIMSTDKNKLIHQPENQINYLKATAEHISEVEKESIQIERSLKDIKKARFLKKHMNDGQVFEGKVVNILSFGFFVDVDQKFQGLVRYELLGEEVEPTENKLKLIDKKNKKTINLYDYVKVKILDINLLHGTIDMELIRDENNSDK